eukprot:1318939-Amphidinium_carterae.1
MDMGCYHFFPYVLLLSGSKNSSETLFMNRTSISRQAAERCIMSCPIHVLQKPARVVRSANKTPCIIDDIQVQYGDDFGEYSISLRSCFQSRCQFLYMRSLFFQKFHQSQWGLFLAATRLLAAEKT